MQGRHSQHELTVVLHLLSARCFIRCSDTHCLEAFFDRCSSKFVRMNHNLWHSTQRCASKPPLLISRVQQRTMGSGQPYMKSGVFSRLKHTLLHGRVPVWAFLLVAGLLLLRLVGVQ